MDKESVWVYKNYKDELLELGLAIEEFLALTQTPTHHAIPVFSRNFDRFNFFHKEMFVQVDALNNDLFLHRALMARKEPVIYGDHTISYRMLNSCKILNDLKDSGSEVSSPGCFIQMVKLDLQILMNDDFLAFSAGYNHAVDQLFAILTYHMKVESLGSDIYQKYLSRLKDEIDKSLDSNFIHVENTPDYHFYAMQRLYQINTVLNDPYFSETLRKMEPYLSYITPKKGAKIISLGDSAGKEVWPPFAHLPLEDSKREMIKWFNSGHLSFKNDEIFFYIKASRRHQNHHHYDNGSFVLSCGDEYFFDDSGMFSYDESDPGRIYCRSALAHNIPSLIGVAPYSERDFTSYTADAIRLKDTRFIFTCRSFKEMRFARMVDFDNTVFTLEDSIELLSPQSDSVVLPLHLGRNIRVTKNSDSSEGVTFLLNGTNHVMELTISCNSHFSSHLVADGMYRNQMVGFRSDKLYTLETCPTILFDFDTKDLNLIEYKLIFKKIK